MVTFEHVCCNTLNVKSIIWNALLHNVYHRLLSGCWNIQWKEEVTDAFFRDSGFILWKATIYVDKKNSLYKFSSGPELTVNNPVFEPSFRAFHILDNPAT